MKFSKFIEKYFWAVLLSGMIIGVWQPVPFEVPKFIPKFLLILMMFFLFLKIDAIEILEKIKNYKLMITIAIIYMFLVPLLFFFPIHFIDYNLALGILLLTAMPAGISSPALTDILKGNIPLAMSIAIVTQLAAPFTIPVLFWVIGSKGLEINELLVFRDTIIIVFMPMLLSQVIKKYFPTAIDKSQHLFTSANILILLLFVYITISSQSELILQNPLRLVWKTSILYTVFILLHLIGYLVSYKANKESKIATSVTSAYMNNGLAIVLASTYFGPDIVVLMVLSEIPWITLLAPFKRILGHL
jgi:predicted Na+-dependent transporter